MITDHLSKLEYYRGLSSRLDQAIDFMMTNDLMTLPLGRIDIDGDNLYANRMQYTASAISNDKNFEIHQRYIDIQVIVSGHEGIALAPMDVLTKVEDLPDNDITFYAGRPDHIVMMRENTFMLLYPGEAHMPGLAIDDQAVVDKIVFKVAY